MTGTVTISTVTLSVHNTQRETGMTYRQLDYGVRRGWFKPLHIGGSGNSREWTRAELEVVRRFGRLRKAGVEPETAAAVARSGQRCEIADGIWIEVTS